MLHVLHLKNFQTTQNELLVIFTETMNKRLKFVNFKNVNVLLSYCHVIWISKAISMALINN